MHAMRSLISGENVRILIIFRGCLDSHVIYDVSNFYSLSEKARSRKFLASFSYVFSFNSLRFMCFFVFSLRFLFLSLRLFFFLF